MTREQIIEICRKVEDMYPYKESGNIDSYSKYNEGWSDACDVLEQTLLESLTQQDEASKEFKKKTKCPVCNGTGKYDYGMVWDHGDPGVAECYNCNGKRYIK